MTNTATDGSYTVTYFQNDLLISSTTKDSGGNQLNQTTFGYDPHGRQTTVADARNGTTTYYFNNADQITSVVTPVPASGQSAQVTTNCFDSLGRIWKTTLPDNTSVTNEFYPTGDLKSTSGSRTYPVGYSYDSQGRLKTMTNWTTFPSTGARITTWNYDGYTGFLTNKVYAGNVAGPSYTYTASGKLQTRLWARGSNTTYTYNSAGDLASVSYNDGSTPAVTNSYDRRGRLSTVTWGTNVCSLISDDAGNVLSEVYSGGLLSGLTVTNVFDSLLRRTTNGVFNGSAWLAQARFTYGAASRLKSVGDGTNYATYSYVTNSPLVSQIWFTNNGALRMTTSKNYDFLNRLTQISSAPSGSSAVSFTYGYNSANQRTVFTNADNSYWAFGYDSLGQVTSGKKYWSDSGLVAGEQFTYSFDDIGNRTATAVGGDQFGGNLRSAAYYANALNQYTNRTVPGYVNILGAAYSGATVTVLGPSGLVASTYRRGDFFRAEPVVDNSSTALWSTLTNFGVLTEGANADIVTNIVGNIYVPKTPEQFSYDPEGNLTNDGRWVYIWDAENRLVRMAANSGVGPSVSLKFEYDWQGRRVHKQVWGNTGWSGTPTNEAKFLYDGWNLVAELNSSNSAIRTYTWGLDLSGTAQGAGGVGGLLAVNDATNGSHFATFDGNGNVAGLVKGADGTTSANYEYGPFGELLRVTGPMSKFNSVRFSSKYQDGETDLLYYGFRYFSPTTGRWSSREPVGEAGGANLYGLLENDSISRSDVLGLVDFVLYAGIRTPSSFGDISGGIRAIPPLSPAVVLSVQDRLGLKLADTGEALWFLNNPKAQEATERAKEFFRDKIGAKVCGLTRGRIPSFVVKPSSQGGQANYSMNQSFAESSFVIGWYEYRVVSATFTRSNTVIKWTAEISIIDKLGWEQAKYSPATWQGLYDDWLSLPISWGYHFLPHDYGQDMFRRTMDVKVNRLFGLSREFSRGEFYISGEADCCKLRNSGD